MLSGEIAFSYDHCDYYYYNARPAILYEKEAWRLIENEMGI